MMLTLTVLVILITQWLQNRWSRKLEVDINRLQSKIFQLEEDIDKAKGKECGC